MKERKSQVLVNSLRKRDVAKLWSGLFAATPRGNPKGGMIYAMTRHELPVAL